MLFRKAINNFCKNFVLNKPHFINKCCNYTDIDATFHVLNPRLTC